MDIVACDLLVTVTASFRSVYVVVATEIGSRRILHTHLTAHPTAQWTLQPAVPGNPYHHQLPAGYHVTSTPVLDA